MMTIRDHYHHPVIYVKDMITMTMMICNHNHLLSHNDHPTIYTNDATATSMTTTTTTTGVDHAATTTTLSSALTMR